MKKQYSYHTIVHFLELNRSLFDTCYLVLWPLRDIESKHNFAVICLFPCILYACHFIWLPLILNAKLFLFFSHALRLHRMVRVRLWRIWMITHAIRTCDLASSSASLLFPSRQQVNMTNISSFISIHVSSDILFYGNCHWKCEFLLWWRSWIGYVLHELMLW